MNKYIYEVFVDGNKIATFYKMSDVLFFIESGDIVYYKDDKWNCTIVRTKA